MSDEENLGMDGDILPDFGRVSENGTCVEKDSWNFF